MSLVEKQKNEFDELLELVSFNLGNEEFGVDIHKVREINKMMRLTRVPNAPFYVEGVINLRGKIIPVIDMRVKLGMEKNEYDKNTRIIVVEVEETVTGFIVDRVSEVLRIPKSITEAPPEMVSGIDSDYITSVGKLEDRLLILLDLNKVFSTQQVVEELA